MAKQQVLTIEAARARAAMPVEVALTLDVPHAWNVSHGDKRAENRSWECGKPHEGRRIAIHASMRRTTDGDVCADIAAQGVKVPAPALMAAGAIVATARVVAFARLEGEKQDFVRLYKGMPDITEDRALALALVREGAWCHGPVIWILDDVRRLIVPIAARGAQRLWKLTPQLRAQVASAPYKRVRP